MSSFLLSAVQSAKTRRLFIGAVIVGGIGAETGLLVLNRFILSGMYFSKLSHCGHLFAIHVRKLER